MTGDLLSLERVTKTYASGGLLARSAFKAVDDVSFTLDAERPEIFAIIGESGSGKTTLARMILHMIPASAGTIRFRGKDVATVRGRWANLDFMRQIQPIFQNPYEAFNPLKRVDRYLYATARYLAGVGRGEMQSVCDDALRNVGLSLTEIRGRFPHELSGGQLQRASIARALISRPALLVADEPVSMVDASLRMSIAYLFKALRDQFGMSIVYITHDLATAYHISDRIIIMQKGRVVEAGRARTVLDDPRHPYSKLLKDAVLQPGDAEMTRLYADPSEPKDSPAL
jgi:ABC-type glutathione transport system ATPase component